MVGSFISGHIRFGWDGVHVWCARGPTVLKEHGSVVCTSPYKIPACFLHACHTKGPILISSKQR